MTSSGEPKGTPRSHLKDGLLTQVGTDVAVAVDLVNAEALGQIQVPRHQSSGAQGPPPIPGAGKKRKETIEMTPAQEMGPFRPQGPETLIGLLSKAHLDYFKDDFHEVEDQFIKLRYHIGQWNQSFELHSEPFPLQVDSWSAMRDRLAEHIRTSLGNVPLDELSQIPVRMVYFHDATLYRIPQPSSPLSCDSQVTRGAGSVTAPVPRHGKNGSTKGCLGNPLDFACWLRLTVGELADLIVEGTPPNVVRLGFDASYHWLGPDTHQPFGYTKHWQFFAEVLLALSRLLGRPLTTADPVIGMLLSHTGVDLADMVLGLGQMDKRSYEARARVYRPRIELVFEAGGVAASFEDLQGIMRLYATDLNLGKWKRQISGNRVTLERRTDV